jgi:anti-anti-sigma factor
VTNHRSTQTPTPADGFELRVKHTEDTVELTLSGELDLSRTAALQAELTQALERLARSGDTPSRLLVDLQNLTFIDSSGMQLLVVARRRALRHGIDLSLQMGDSPVRRILTLAGVAEFLGLE